jgi:hypothetical protein
MDTTSPPRDVAAWLQDALDDAARRHLPDLEPLLRSLAQATALLRAGDWNDDPCPPAPAPET